MTPPEKTIAPRNRTLHLSAADLAHYGAQVELLDPARAYSVAEAQGRIWCGDAVTGLNCLPPASADLIIADPPYNMRKDYGGTPFSRKSQADYAEWTEAWVAAAVRVLKPAGTLYACIDWESSGMLQASLGRHLTIKNRITWKRDKGRGATRNWKNNMEDIWFCVASDAYYFDVEAVKVRKKVIAPYRDEQGKPKDWAEDPAGERYRFTHPANIWDDMVVPFWSMPENTSHPTQKPEKLVARLMRASSRPGDLVVDPFMGSGTTAAVAAQLGRTFTGFEIDPTYCALTYKRLDMQAERPAKQEKPT